MNATLAVWVFALLLFPLALDAKPGDPIPFYLRQDIKDSHLTTSLLSKAVEAQIFESTNRLREKEKRASLHPNETLVKIAREHSKDMLVRKYLSHFSPEGKSVVDRTRKYVKEVRTSLGENLHMIQAAERLRDPEAIASQMMQDWSRSPSHRKNLLSKDYQQLGVGCENDGRKIYCTQVFSGANLR